MAPEYVKFGDEEPVKRSLWLRGSTLKTGLGKFDYLDLTYEWTRHKGANNTVTLEVRLCHSSLQSPENYTNSS